MNNHVMINYKLTSWFNSVKSTLRVARNQRYYLFISKELNYLPSPGHGTMVKPIVNFPRNYRLISSCNFCLTSKRRFCTSKIFNEVTCTFWICLVYIYGVERLSLGLVETTVKIDVLSPDEELFWIFGLYKKELNYS